MEITVTGLCTQAALTVCLGLLVLVLRGPARQPGVGLWGAGFWGVGLWGVALLGLGAHHAGLALEFQAVDARAPGPQPAGAAAHLAAGAAWLGALLAAACALAAAASPGASIRRRRLMPWSLALLAVAVVLVAATASLAPAPMLVVRSGLRSVIVGLAMLGAALVIVRRGSAPRRILLVLGLVGLAAASALDFAAAVQVLPVERAGFLPPTLAVTRVAAAALAGIAVALALITEERRRARAVEDRLRASERRYRRLVEGAPVAICELDADLRIVTANPAAANVLARAPGRDLVPTPFLDLVALDDRERVRLESRCARRDGSALFGCRSSEAPEPGRSRELLATLSTLRDAASDDGDATLAAYVVDVTNASGDAERPAAEQPRESAKLEAVGRLAGGIAHDFNNILTALLGNADLLLPAADAASAFGPDERHRVEEIKKLGERAATLTNQLLAFSRQQVLRPRVVNVDRCIGGLESMLRRLIRSDIDLAIRLDAPAANVRIDPGQLEQVVVNLVVNASEAMPRGGELGILTEVVEDAGSRSRDVRVTVSDTGQGIDEQAIDRIFEPFFTTKRHQGGTGLGLASVHGIVEQSGGSVHVASRPGRTVFTVDLPCVTEHADAVATDVAPAATPATGDETVLVCDDNPAVRRVMENALRAGGYSVLGADRPEEAIDLARAHAGRIPLLITDAVMPGMSGKQLMGAIERIQPGLCVLFVSGYAYEAVDTEAMGARVDFLAKPFGTGVLLAAVRALLDRRAPAARSR